MNLPACLKTLSDDRCPPACFVMSVSRPALYSGFGAQNFFRHRRRRQTLTGNPAKDRPPIPPIFMALLTLRWHSRLLCVFEPLSLCVMFLSLTQDSGLCTWDFFLFTLLTQKPAALRLVHILPPPSVPAGYPASAPRRARVYARTTLSVHVEGAAA